MTPERIQRKRTKGWRLPANTVCVSRPGRYGNPFDWQLLGREEAVRRFRLDLLARLEGDPHCLDELRGRNMACWCKPGEPCHADILLELANP